MFPCKTREHAIKKIKPFPIGEFDTIEKTGTDRKDDPELKMTLVMGLVNAGETIQHNSFRPNGLLNGARLPLE